MRQLVYMSVMLFGMACAMPQQGAQITDPNHPLYTKILSYEAHQTGSNFGLEFFQDDGTAAGQKIGPDGLIYGFYTYIQEGGNRVKVYWRAGEGVGYEVIGTEGLPTSQLGNLRATINNPAPVTHAPVPVTRRPITQAPIIHRQPATHAPVIVRQPVIPVTPAPILDLNTPAPHRFSGFDYPATLNLERTATGFVSSLKAT